MKLCPVPQFTMALAEVVSDFVDKFGKFRRFLVQPIFHDLNSMGAGTALLPRSVTVVPFLRTVELVFVLNSHMLEVLRKKNDSYLALERFGPMSQTCLLQYYECSRPFLDEIRRCKNRPGLASLISRLRIETGMTLEENVDLPFAQLVKISSALPDAPGSTKGKIEIIKVAINQSAMQRVSEKATSSICESWAIPKHKFDIRRPGRCVIKKGKLIRTNRNAESVQEVVLLNDAIIFGVSSGSLCSSLSRTKFLDWIDLRHAKIGVVSNPSLRASLESIVPRGSSVGTAALALLASNHENRHSAFFTIFVEGEKGCKLKSPISVLDLCEWWIVISQTIEKIHKDSSEPSIDALSPVLQPWQKNCASCESAFNFIRRRCHCNMCGLLLCSNCCHFRSIRPMAQKKNGTWDIQPASVRVCKACFIENEMQLNRTENPLQLVEAKGQPKQPLQSEAKIPNVPQKLTDASPRRRVVQEIISSEETYLAGLRLLRDFFMRPLFEDFLQNRFEIGGEIMGAINPKDLTSIYVFFSDVESIFILSEGLLRELEERLRNDDLSVGDIFMDMAPLFRLYDEYSSCFEFATKTIMEHMASSKKLCKFLEEQAEKFADGTLQSLLILPIQRLPRYLLLLRELAKMEGNELYDKQLGPAIIEIEGVTRHVNEKIREREGMVRMFDLLKTWGPIVFKGGPADREFILQADLSKENRRNAVSKYRFLLLSDALLYGTASGSSITHHRTFPLVHCRVLSKESKCFEIHGREKSIAVRASTAEEKELWIGKIEACIRKELEKHNVLQMEMAPVWMKNSAQCTLCSTQFDLFHRPHHCRKCGKCVCNSCSTRRWVLPNVDPNRSVRVCLHCFGTLRAKFGFSIEDEEKVAGELGENTTQHPNQLLLVRLSS